MTRQPLLVRSLPAVLPTSRCMPVKTQFNIFFPGTQAYMLPTDSDMFGYRACSSSSVFIAHVL